MLSDAIGDVVGVSVVQGTCVRALCTRERGKRERERKEREIVVRECKCVCKCRGGGEVAARHGQHVAGENTTVHGGRIGDLHQRTQVS